MDRLLSHLTLGFLLCEMGRAIITFGICGVAQHCCEQDFLLKSHGQPAGTRPASQTGFCTVYFLLMTTSSIILRPDLIAPPCHSCSHVTTTPCTLHLTLSPASTGGKGTLSLSALAASLTFPLCLTHTRPSYSPLQRSQE